MILASPTDDPIELLDPLLLSRLHHSSVIHLAKKKQRLNFSRTWVNY